MRKSILSKLAALAVVGALVFSVAACDNTPGTTAAPTDAVTEAPADGTDAPDDTDAPTEPAETDEPTEPSETEEPVDPSETEEPTEPSESEDPSDPSETEGPDSGEVTADLPADRYDATETPRTGNNATTPLVLQTGTLDSKFSPFFYTSAYDNDVISMTSLGLLYYDKDGTPNAGVEYPSLAYDFSQEVNDDSTESLYTFVLKNGLTFSDGEPITIDDVIFSMYVYSDPFYDGISTFYTMNIAGMREYRLQTSSEMIETVNAIKEAGISGEGSADPVFGEATGAAAESQAAYWAYLPEAGKMFAQDIVNYIHNTPSVVTDEYVQAKFSEDLTYAQISENDNLKVAYAMKLWGFGEMTDATTFVDGTDTSYNVESDEITAETFWQNLTAAYGWNLSPDDGINYEASGEMMVEDYIDQMFFENEGAVSGGVESIEGITKTTVTGDDGVEREALEVRINGVDPTAIFKLGVTVSPEHYYNDGYSGEVNENGVAIRNQEYMDHLKTKNEKPVGAGPYVFQSYENNVVTYTANDSFLMGSPKIQTVRYQEVAGGSEMDSLRTNTVHYANPSASQEVVNTISTGEGDYAKLDYILVDNDGYGYIGIQGQLIPELKVRQAIAHAMNPQLAVDDFYGELGSVNYRTMTKVQWAYPDNPEALYPYDGTGETSKNLFIEAGYVYDEAANTMSYPEGHANAGQQVNIKMTLPSASESHPAGVIFLDTQKVLESIGVVTEIEVDQNLLSKLSTAYDSGIQIWAAAWGSGGVDPDMFQIWYSDPNENQGTSAARSGLYYLFQNGDEETKAMLTELNELITAGRASLDTEERKPIYHRALELSTGLAVEVPTYQRKNMFAYNQEVIKADTMFSGDDVTPFQSPIAFIWNVELN